MRWVVLLLAAAVVAGLLRERLAAPFHVLALYTRPPDAVLRMPVEGVRVARVSNTWRAPRPGDRTHEGQDIFARRGTPVRSATAGVVLRIGENRLGGLTVTVLGAGGRLYYYAHLDAYAEGLQTGRAVTPQTVLGYVGNTGNARSTPPHLHFGVYARGAAINPLPLLEDRGP
ncbi:MAG: M23 family metallopeptidase [Bryobacteraceae bacterium]|nr:M23 family metallopeptidase [Bryobacteraceae bacterium]